MKNIMLDVLIPTLKSTVNVPSGLKDMQAHLCDLPGRSRARNSLSKIAESEYLLFIDDDIEFSKEIFEKYILPNVENNQIISYEGNNVLCTRVLGIPKELFFLVDGFDTTFNVGEDIEFGYRLMTYGLKINKIPKKDIIHCGKNHSSSWISNYLVRVRLVLRYKKYEYFLPLGNYKEYPKGLVTMIFGFYRYFFDNKRKGIAAIN